MSSLVKHISIGGENADIVDSRIPESSSSDQNKLLQIDSTGAFKLVSNDPSVVGVSLDTSTNVLKVGNGDTAPRVKLATLSQTSSVTPSQIESAVGAVAGSGVTQEQMAILAGVTATGTGAVTANDLNTLSGINAAGVVPADLKTLAGAAANGLTAADLTKLAAIDATAAEINALNGSGIVKADLEKLHGVTADASELNILDGVSGVTAADINVLGGASGKVTAADLEKLGDVTASADELNVLDGITATTAELNYMDGVTSNVQTQLNDITSNIGSVPSGKTLQGEIDTLNGDASTTGSVAKKIADAIGAIDSTSTNESALKTVDKVTQVDGVVTTTFKDIAEMTAATSSTAGVKGLVPASAAGEQNKLLTAGKTWVAVADDLTTDSATQPLSAKQGKALSERITSLETMGRYLALWDAATGLPTTNPTTSPFLYKSGDWYSVGVVAASGSDNYKPNGSSYTKDVPSTTKETATLRVGDRYIYDGSAWSLQQGSDPDAVKDVQIQTGSGSATSIVSSSIATIKADGSTVEFNTDGKLQVKDAGISSAKLANGAVGVNAISTAIVDGTISTTSGSENKIATQNTVSTAVAAIPEFNPGATTPVKKGLVPTAESGDSGKFLKGDGTWADIPADALVMTATVNLSAGTFTVDKAPSEVLAARGDKQTVLIYVDTGALYGTIMAEITQIFTADDENKGDFATNIPTADGQFVIKGEAGTTAYTGSLYHRPIQKAIDIVEDTGLSYTASTAGYDYDELQGLNFTGATSTANGKMGMVPAPSSADINKFLKADGNWSAVDSLPTQTGNNGKYLTTNGTAASWVQPVYVQTGTPTGMVDKAIWVNPEKTINGNGVTNDTYKHSGEDCTSITFYKTVPLYAELNGTECTDTCMFYLINTKGPDPFATIDDTGYYSQLKGRHYNYDEITSGLIKGEISGGYLLEVQVAYLLESQAVTGFGCDKPGMTYAYNTDFTLNLEPVTKTEEGLYVATAGGGTTWYWNDPELNESIITDWADAGKIEECSETNAIPSDAEFAAYTTATQTTLTADDIDKFTAVVPVTRVDTTVYNASGKGGSGEWVDITPVMVGADGSNVGAAGMVPVPQATDNEKFLKGDGTWATVTAGVSEVSVDGASIVESGVADLKTSSTHPYDPDSNVLATMGDISAAGGGTVTEITAGTGLVTEDGNPITTSGSIGLDDGYGDAKNPYGNKTQNHVLAAPSDRDGEPEFRALVAADIPDLSGTYATSAQGALADSSVQSVSLGSGSSNGTVKLTVNGTAGTDVAVTGLKSAAYTESGAYATSTQGSKADTAIQSVSLTSGTNDGTLKLTVGSTDTDNIAVTGLGSAAYTASTDYATADQGAKADTALQTHQTVTLGSGSTDGTLKLTVGGTAGTDVAVTGLKSAAYTESSAYVAAGSAVLLGSTSGSNTQPVYINGDGEATAIDHTIEADVPSGAVFTDTKVTSADNHYTPSKTTTKSASGATGTIGNTVQVVTGIEMDSKGHVTGVTSGAATDTQPNDAKLTIQAAGTTKGTFTANASTNQTINITAGDLGLSSAMTFVGESTTDPTTSGATISGHTTWKAGEVVIYGTNHTEYVNKDGNNTSASWINLGGAGSYVLNTVKVEGANGLTGGGALSGDQTISHAAGASAGASKSSGLYKFSTDSYGHVSAVTSVAKSDLTDLGLLAANSAITGGTKCKITYDNNGLVTGGANLDATDIPNLAASKITSGTFSDTYIASASTWNAKLNASDIEEGSANGTISVKKTNVTVHGLGSAAFTASTEYATSAQGSKADTAVQSVSLTSGTNNGTLKLTVGTTSTDNIAVKGLGSAAYTASTAYATADQGTKADNAAPKVKTKTIAVPTSGWTASGSNYTQVITSLIGASNLTQYSMVNLEPNATVIGAMADASCTAMYAENNGASTPVITLTAVGGKPADISVQVSIVETTGLT